MRIQSTMRGFFRSMLHGRVWVGFLLAGVLLLQLATPIIAAEMQGGEIYRLAEGEVVEDDLYVTGGEIYIDGEVKGDLVAAGGYIEVNGLVSGDLIAAGGAIVLNGVVQDDARLAGGSINLAGQIGDDLLVAGGGGWAGAAFFPMRIGDRTVAQGVRLANITTVGGDAFVVGGDGLLASSFEGDLFAAMNRLVFTGQVQGDASLNAETLQIGEDASVGGTLEYSTPNPVTVPSQVASDVVAVERVAPPEEAAPDLLSGLLGWLLRTLLILVGLALLAWLALRLFPTLLRRPVETLDADAVVAGLYGLLVAVLALPVAAALVFLVGLFWNWFPGGVAMFMFVFGGLALVWILSPLVTGLWLGRKIALATGMPSGDLVAILVGVAAIVLLGRAVSLIPCVGGLAYGLIYLLSFALATGGWLATGRAPKNSVPEQSLPEQSAPEQLLLEQAAPKQPTPE